jgi:Glycosyltransferase family 87
VLGLVAACAAVAWPERSPLVPQDGGRHVGDRSLAVAFLVCAGVGYAAYVAGAFALRRWEDALRLRAVLALAVAIQLVPLGAPLLLSTDAWAYWAYGRIAASLGGNPYADEPLEFGGDTALEHLGADWRGTTSVYGPAFTLASEPLALAAGESEDAAAWIYKAAAAAAMLACTLLAARLARRRSLAAALVGWNPLLALHFAGGGHNDAWMIALVLGALAAGATGRPRLAGAAWALGVLVKWIPLLFLPLRALEARATGRRVDHLGFALVVALVAALATWRYGRHWLLAVVPLARNAERETSFALPHRLQDLGVPSWLAIGLLAAAFVVAYVWLLREAARGRARLGLAAGLLLVAIPYVTPWYVVWTLPLAAAEDDDAAQLLALGMGAYLLPQTIPI